MREHSEMDRNGEGGRVEDETLGQEGQGQGGKAGRGKGLKRGGGVEELVATDRGIKRTYKGTNKKADTHPIGQTGGQTDSRARSRADRRYSPAGRSLHTSI
jgi:hypothetical protein